jgi:hypothetical protein
MRLHRLHTLRLTLALLSVACSRSNGDQGAAQGSPISNTHALPHSELPPSHPAANSDTNEPKNVKAFYFGHSLLAGSKASPNYHIPYDIGLFAATKGHRYETHGQLGWGTPLEAHWKWDSDRLADGPPGFASENHAPFYAGRNGKSELSAGGYNVVVFTDVNGHARGEKQGPTVAALVGLIKLARAQDAHALAVLYSVWNELSVEAQKDRAAVKKWRDETLAELRWWEGVADAAKAKSDRLLLVPVSVVFAELVWDAANGRVPGQGAALEAKAFFLDEVHGTPLAYYAAAAALYSAIFREPSPSATTELVRGSVGGATVDFGLPSTQTAQYIQQRAFEIVRDYPRAGVH